nr:hypothetical protein [Tanacetum cinerariifolium]
MDMTIDQQVPLDDAFVPHASRLRIGKRNFRLRSDITSKESTLQLVYDVLRLTPFYKEFLVTTDVLEIYIHEFFATATVHHHSICFKMDNKKRIVNLEYFREMLHICPRLPSQTFDELPFEEEILAFLRFLGTTKANVRKTKSSSDTTITPPTVAGIRLSTSAKGKQPAKSSKAEGLTVLSEVVMTEAEQMKLATKRSLQQTHISQASGSGADEGTGIITGVLDVPTDESDEEISWKSSDEDNDDEVNERSDDQEEDNDPDDDDKDKAKDKESFDPIIQTLKNYDDKGNDDASLGLNVGREGQDVDDDDKELYRDVNINLEGRDVQMTDVYTTQEYKDTHVTLTLVNPDGQQQSLSVSSQFVTSMLNPSPDAGIDSLFEKTPQVDVHTSTTVAPLTLTAPNLPHSTIPTIYQVPQATTPLKTAPSTLLHDLLNFGSLFGFNHRLKTLEANFSEFVKTNQFAGAVSSILGIVKRYMDQRMNEEVKVAVQIQPERLRDEA